MYVTLWHIMMSAFNINTDTNGDECQFASCTHLKTSYNTYAHCSQTHDIIQRSISLLSWNNSFLSSKNFTWATVQWKNSTSCPHKVLSNYKNFSVSNIHQPSGLYHCLPSPPPSVNVVEYKQLNEGLNTCAWTSCSGYILYNWPLRMHTSTIDTRMIRHTMTATPRQHPITIGTTGIEWAAGRTVCREWRTTQSLWIVWRNVHWVGGTHTLTYRR